MSQILTVIKCPNSCRLIRQTLGIVCRVNLRLLSKLWLRNIKIQSNFPFGVYKSYYSRLVN